MTIYVPMSPENSSAPGWHATTILSVRKGGQVVMAGDGQVSMGQTIVKGNAKKVRRLGNGLIVTRLKIVPFVATLGMMGVARGLAQTLSKGQRVTFPNSQEPPSANA